MASASLSARGLSSGKLREHNCEETGKRSQEPIILFNNSESGLMHIMRNAQQETMSKKSDLRRDDVADTHKDRRVEERRDTYYYS